MGKDGKIGGPIGFILSILALILAITIVVAFIRINDIHNFTDVKEYFQNKSEQVDKCTSGKGWECDLPDLPNKDDSDSAGDNKSDGDESKEDDDPSAVNPGDFKGDTKDFAEKLDKIKIVKPEKVDYNRGDWKHWTGSPCNTREEVLKEQGKNVKTGDNCKIVSGTWIDPFTGKTFTNSSELDIDHFVPIGYTATHGGANWPAEKKEKFANDQSHLMGVSASANRAKGSKGPGSWMPENKDFTCDYAKIWINTTTKYKLGIEKKDKEALNDALKTCK